MMAELFCLRVAIRSDDLDTNGHVRGPVYLAYADHARWQWIAAAGASVDELLAAGIGPVNLETTIRFHSELLGGDAVEVTVEPDWGEGRTYRLRQELRLSDETLAAEVTSVSGLLDLNSRCLLPDAAEGWRSVATTPEQLGL
jgi:acyl-CoA thioester hydrolase